MVSGIDKSNAKNICFTDDKHKHSVSELLNYELCIVYTMMVYSRCLFISYISIDNDVMQSDIYIPMYSINDHIYIVYIYLNIISTYQLMMSLSNE